MTTVNLFTDRLKSKSVKNSIINNIARDFKVERWTQQAFDQGGLLSQLDLAVLMSINEATAREYVREYQSLYNRTLPTRGNIQMIGGGQTLKYLFFTGSGMKGFCRIMFIRK